jgi:hypothetical protein
MKKIIIILAIFLLLPLAMAQTVDESISNLVANAEQYELGNINYMELVAYNGIVRENINQELGSVHQEDGPSAVSLESIEDYFGTPSEYTRHAWNSRENKEAMLDEPVPTFRKILFDGKRIQITLNAWPQVYTKDGEEILGYSINSETKFKEESSFSYKEAVNELQSLARAYNEGSSNGDELAKKMAEYQNILNQELYNGVSGECEDKVGKYFSSDQLMESEDRTRYSTEFYEGKNMDARLILQVPSCEGKQDCWPWINMWIEHDFFFDHPFEGDFDFKEGYDRDQLKDTSIEELESMFTQELSDLHNTITQMDDGDASWGTVESKLHNVRTITEVMLEQKSWNYQGGTEGFNEVLSFVQSKINTYGSTSQETVKETRYENRLVSNEEENKDSWCKDLSKERCDITQEACIEGACTYALGGDETCDNGQDDDGDTVADCDDPDCAQECGKICSPVCEESCWPLVGQNCQSECRECWDCDWQTEDCEPICESSGCRSCEQEQKSSSACSECNSCEQSQQQATDCTSECNSCNTCIEGKSLEDYALCETECQPCVECRTPKNYECHQKCDEISESGSIASTCKKLCDENVIFYCGGEKSLIPCDGVDYICEGNVQPFPCTIYTCTDENGVQRKQTVACGEESFCGENQHEKDGKCVCLAGHYDCDADGSCESDTGCGEDTEICNDQVDNDGDYLVDCSDLSECRLMECGMTDSGETKICYEGSCQAQSEITICEDTQTLVNGECINNCETVEECAEGEVCQYGLCQILSTCEYDADCLTNEECKEGYCETIEETGCVFDEECAEGENCLNNVCTIVECTTDDQCTNNEVCQNQECGDRESCHEGACIESEVVEQPEETGEGCTVAEDCSGERDICSNGICKEIPEENYEDLVDEGLLVEEPEQQPEEETTQPEPSEDNTQEQQPEEQVEQQPEEQPAEEITGLFLGTGFFLKDITGMYFQEGNICETNEDCNTNQGCDTYSGNCYCEQGYFDCNSGNERGYDSDGCESTDVTCGGDRELCPEGCGENQECSEQTGWCECSEGYYNCDGTWWDCESTTNCEGCSTNDECAQSVCDPNQGGVVLHFGCAEGSSWVEQKGAFSFSGGCTEYTSGQTDYHIHFDSWGEPFDEINQLRAQYENNMHKGWCEMELNNALNERKEIEASMNQAFYEWFFTDFVSENPEDWETQMSALFDSYWSIVDNSRTIARASQCLDKDFADINPISEISYESEYGEITFWETTAYSEEFDMQMNTPLMEVWIFPPEEIFKSEMQKAMETGVMPGGESEAGPSQEELDEIRNNEEEMQHIRELVSDYDDQKLDILMQVLDGDELVFQIDMTIDETNLIQVTPTSTYNKEADITIEIDSDFLYNLISTTEKEGWLEHPEWYEPGFDKKFKDIKTGASMAGKVSGAIATGSISIKPLSEVPTAMELMGQMFE